MTTNGNNPDANTNCIVPVTRPNVFLPYLSVVSIICKKDVTNFLQCITVACEAMYYYVVSVYSNSKRARFFVFISNVSSLALSKIFSLYRRF